MMASVGERLRAARLDRNLNQTEFARLGGVGRNSQLQYEAGEVPPKMDYFLRLQDAGVDAAFILFGTVGGEALSPGESELVTLLRRLRPGWNEAILAIVRQAAADQAAPASATLHERSRGFRAEDAGD